MGRAVGKMALSFFFAGFGILQVLGFKLQFHSAHVESRASWVGEKQGEKAGRERRTAGYKDRQRCVNSANPQP